MGKKKTKNKKRSTDEIQKPWALVLLDVDGTTQKIKSPNRIAGDRICVNLVENTEVEVLYVADTENNLNRYLVKTWENSDRAYAIYKESARRKRTKPIPEKGFLAVSSSEKKKALVLLDINGITKIINAHNHKVEEKFEVALDTYKDNVKVEVLHIADTEEKLIIYLENIWEDSARAFAIYKEYTRRQRRKLKETDNYLAVSSSEIQKPWALVLVDVDGTTKTMQSPNRIAGERICDNDKDQVEYEVLYVAETEDKLNVYLENIWEDSSRAFAIYKEYAERTRTKPKQDKGSLKDLSSVVNENHTTTDQVKSKPNPPTTTEHIKCKPNTHSTTEQVESKSKTNTTTEQVEIKKPEPERQSKMDYLKAFGRHLQRQKSIYGLIITVALLLLGFDIKDIIEVFRLFDPLVSKKIYEVLVVLINKTDDG